MTPQRTCKEMVKPAFNARLSELKVCWKAYTEDKDIVYRGETYTPESFSEYGLGFDYVAPRTFKGQKLGYFRYQLSWGGPSEELRYYVRAEYKQPFKVYKVEFWYLDWFDGAKTTMRAGKNFEFLTEIFEFFKDCGSVETVYMNAIEEMYEF